MNNFIEHSYLCHHGIPDMKWGVRRFQNKDGSLTAAGKIRYGSGKKVFVSSKNSGYYRKELLSNIKSAINAIMKKPYYALRTIGVKNITQSDLQLQMRAVEAQNQMQLNNMRFQQQTLNDIMRINTMSALRSAGMRV